MKEETMGTVDARSALELAQENELLREQVRELRQEVDHLQEVLREGIDNWWGGYSR